MALYDKVLKAISIAEQAGNAANLKVVAAPIGSNYAITLTGTDALVFDNLADAQKAADKLNKVLVPVFADFITQYDSQIKKILDS